MDQPLLIGTLTVLGRLLVGGMLVLAGGLKLKAGPRWFLRQILAYELVKGKAAWLLARGLPSMEIFCGVLLLVGFATPLITVLGFILLGAFTAALISTFLRGKPVDCGCFGQKNDTRVNNARWTVVYRNLSLMFVLAAISTINIAPLSVDALLNDWRNYNPTIAKLLTTLWVSSLIITVSLHLWTRRRLILTDYTSQSPSVPRH